MRANLEDNLARKPRLQGAFFSTLEANITASYTIRPDGPQFLWLNPGSATISVFLPPITKNGGQFYIIGNTAGSTGVLALRDTGGILLRNIVAGGIAFAMSSALSWHISTISSLDSTVIPGGPFFIFNDPINGLIAKPITSSDLPAAQINALGAVKAFTPLAGKALVGLDEGGAFLTDTLTNLGVREKLTASRSYFVRSAPALVSFTTASDLVNWTAHGLTANSEVVFSITSSLKVAVSGPVFTGGNPSVAWTAHGLQVGTPVRWTTTGTLPGGLSANATYYVIATGFGANAFQYSTTPIGAAVTPSTSGTGTHQAIVQGPSFTNGSSTISWPGHNLAVNQPVIFSTTGALPTNFTAGTKYYVVSAPTSSTFTVSATSGGAVITAGSAGSGSHFGQPTGTMPTNVVEGTTYFVANPGVNSFQISATSGGAVIDIAGTPEGQMWGQFGSDTNDGLTALTPFMTGQKGIDAACSIDLTTFTATVLFSAGTYTQPLTLRNYVGGGSVTLTGAGTAGITINGVNGGATVNIANGTAFTANGTPLYTIANFNILTPGVGQIGINVTNAAKVFYANISFGTSGGSHIQSTTGGQVTQTNRVAIAGNCALHINASTNATVAAAGFDYIILNVPAIATAFVQSIQSAIVVINGNTWNGAADGAGKATGSQGTVATNGTVDTIAGGTGINNYLPGTAATFTVGAATGGVYA